MGYLRIENISKAYKRYAKKSGRFLEWLGLGIKHDLVYVLKDISFEVAPGEAVGIIGVNGTGKSTLLKIIAGTVRPTTGRIVAGGSISALLELGMGFHPDFTGRENVYMAAQLKGISRDEVTRLMPEIEAFAEIGDYIDQPVRTYSSGMQVRLAFSVATCIRPDILIVDEALSVGDAAFQRKCFGRIESFRSAGTTLLFVSHSTETVKTLCNRAVFIKNAQLAQIGPAKQVCDEYERYLFGDRVSHVKLVKGGDSLLPKANVSRFDASLVPSCEMIYGNGKADIISCWLEDTNGCRINVIEAGIPFCWCYRVRFNQNIEKPIFAMMLKTKEGVAIYGVDTTKLHEEITSCSAGDLLEIRFSLQNFLAPGIYYLNCGVRVSTVDGEEFLSRRVDSAILRVPVGPTSTVAVGLVDLTTNFSITKVIEQRK